MITFHDDAVAPLWKHQHRSRAEYGTHSDTFLYDVFDAGVNAVVNDAHRFLAETYRWSGASHLAMALFGCTFKMYTV